MAKWLEQASQWHEMYYYVDSSILNNEMYCHDLEVMSSNPIQGEPGVRRLPGKDF